MTSLDTFPFWRGSRSVVAAGGHVVTPHADPDLARLLDAGRPLLLIARNSGSVGRAGCRRAVVDLGEAAGELRDRFGVDFSACLPTPEVVAEWLFTTPYKVTSEGVTGNQFTNRFLVLDFRPSAPLVVSVSAGSGLKEDAEFSQPHAVHLRNGLLSSHVAFAGFFAKRFDRMVRSTWSTGQLLQSLRALGKWHGEAWAADGDGGRWPVGETADLMFAMRGNGAQMEAANIVRKRTLSLRRLTGTRFDRGRVPYVLSAAPPPGLMTYRDRVTGGGFLALDTPDNYPEVNDTRGLPNVRHDDGTLVDQVANVQWFLSQWGRPGTPFLELVEELRARRFSTQALRSRRDGGPAAHWGLPESEGYRGRASVATAIRRMFVKNLHLYETGELVRHLNGDEIVISNVFPLGEWATAEDFARIRHDIEQRAVVARRRSSWSWSGMPILLDGHPRVLQPARRAYESATSPHQFTQIKWGFHTAPVSRAVIASTAPDTLSEGHAEEDRSPRGYRVPVISDSVLTAAVVQALLDADGAPVAVFSDDSRHERERRRDEQALLDLRARLDLLVDEQARTRRLLRESLDDGTPLAGAALRRELTAEFEEQATAIETAVAEISRREAIARAAAAAPAAGISPARMSRVVTGLRDARASEVRDLLRDGVRNLRFDSSLVVGPQGLRTTRMDFGGDLVLATETAAWSVPFRGHYDSGPVHAYDDRAVRAVARMRRGEPRRGHRAGAINTATDAANRLLAESTGHAVGLRAAAAVSNCADPALMRVSMATLFPHPVEGEDPASIVDLGSLIADDSLSADFGDVARLARRIRVAYCDAASSVWLRHPAGVREVGAILDSHRQVEPPIAGNRFHTFSNGVRARGRDHRWALSHGRRPTFTPCPACGSRLAGVMRLREVSGYLCLEPHCRRDEAGVQWPSRFDRFVSQPGLYVSAGVALDVPPGYRGTAAELVVPLTSPIIPPRRRRGADQTG